MDVYNLTRALFIPSLVFASVLPWGDGVDNMPIHYLEALHPDCSGLASFLVRVLENVRVTAGEGSLELAELGTQLSAANVEAANNEAKLERKVSDISFERENSHIRYMSVLAVAFLFLIVIKIWSSEATDNEGKLEKKVSVISSERKNSHIGYMGVLAVGFLFLVVKKIFSFGFREAFLDFLENFAPTLYSGCLHYVERSYAEKQKDAKEMLESLAWMKKVARVTAAIIE